MRISALTRPARHWLAPLALLLAAACATEDLTTPPEPLGDFALGFAIVVARNAEPVGPSRKATPEEWEAALKTEIEKRTGRYDGEKLYHIGANVNAYALAVPGIPIVAAPKSVLVVSVNVYDDSANRRINAEPRQFTVFEGMSGETVIGSGLTRTREQQIAALSGNAARLINEWLVENKAWFTPEAVAARATLPPMTDVQPGPATAATPAAIAAN